MQRGARSLPPPPLPGLRRPNVPPALPSLVIGHFCCVSPACHSAKACAVDARQDTLAAVQYPLVSRRDARSPLHAAPFFGLGNPSSRWAAALLLWAALFAPRAGAVVTFDFQFTDAAGTGFNDPAHPEYKTALISAGQTMGSYFAHTATVTMTVASINDPNVSTLAYAGSGIVAINASSGFFPTVVQAKVISNGATDLNGADADGEVTVNLGANFQFDPNAALGPDQIDFRATIIHELTHAFGFISYIPQSPSTQPALYSVFDSFMTNASGTPLINPSTFTFNPNELSTLTGGNNTLLAAPSPTGYYFDGRWTRASFGGQPVPIFSPNPYEPGSNGSHVDDNTEATHSDLMSAAAEASYMAGVVMARTYSPAEAGMMTDLGYTLASGHAAFFTGEAALGEGVYYLAFPNGNVFGYYEFLSNPAYLYHFDLGFEYVFDANDGQSGVYFYDFTSSDYFYTSPVFPFPYLYDFGLKAFLYYYPNTSSAGHYTSNPRYFYDFATQRIITK